MNFVLLTPAWPYRGGIAAFSERLSRQLMAEGHNVRLYTFTLQYPGFLFPGKTQYSEEPEPRDLTIERRLSSVNPLTWLSLGKQIKKEAPDVLLLAYWMPFMAPSMGTVARLARGNGRTRVVALCHNLIPHEHRPGDTLLTRWLLGSVDGVMALSQSVCDDVHRFRPLMPTVASPHPIYDSFGQPVAREEACLHLGLDPQRRYLLFFGLIRSYKGLDWLLEACAKSEAMRQGRYKLIVAGEFYSGEEEYRALASRYALDDVIEWRTTFIPDSEVRHYFSAADLVVQPYKTATQSGVTQIAYHFQKPMLVTRVGGLPEIVPDGKVGYVAEPDPLSIAAAIDRFAAELPDFHEGLQEEKQRYSWEVFSQKLASLCPKNV